MSEPGADSHEKLTLTETIGSVLWFVMDGCWMLGFAVAAKAMVLPTVAVNLLVFRYTRRSFSQIAVVAAMNAWLLMNVFWMVADLDKIEQPLTFARLFFVLGIALLVLATGRNATRPEHLTKVLAHFRRLRT